MMNSNNMDKNILVTNIQRFSLHDGPGIRTTVFLKGCLLRCPWCCNPENLIPKPQKYIKDGIEGIYGSYMSCDDIYQEVIKDRIFYLSDDDNEIGGVTFSGGEALLQIDKLESLLLKLKNEGIHLAIETCLFAPESNLSLAIKYIDFFYVDMKILNPIKCKEFERGDVSLYLKNLNTLFKSNKKMVIRIPVIGGYTDTLDNQNLVIDLLNKYKPQYVELVKEHNLGNSKYESLNIPVPTFIGVSDELLDNYSNKIKALGIDVKICTV